MIHSRDGFLGHERTIDHDLRTLCERGSAAYVPFQAGFTLTGQELATLDFGKDREIVLCRGGVPEMRGLFNQSVGKAVATQPYPRAFWEGIERGTIQL